MHHPARTQSPGRPSPKLAWRLSAVLPGAGQAYLGQLGLAPLFTAVWVVSIIGMLDVLTTFRHSPYQLLFGACAVLLGGGSWFLSTHMARRRAERMTAHGTVYRWIARKPVLRRLFLREWRDLVLSLAFALVAAGNLGGVPLAQFIGRQIMWWWPYEILGTLFLMVYAAFSEGFSGKLDHPAKRILLLGGLFAALAVALHLAFKFPPGALAASGLIILPGFVPVLTFGSEKDRIRFFHRAGRSFCVLILCFFFPTAFVASILERPGVKIFGRYLFEGSVMLLWGAFHFSIRAFLEAVNCHAAVRQGEGDDPRWG